MTRLPAAEWNGRPELHRLALALGAENGLCRYVGGAVRDTLLGHAVSDIDIATALPPEQVLERVRAAEMRAVPTGLAHGTVTVVLADGPVEVTTLRRDVETDGRHARVAFTGDWRADAARRDFTINALSAEPLGHLVHDYFEGLADLAEGRVRFIGAPLDRIAEDHLRILRFFRFHARFGRGPADPEALAACTARATDLAALSRERIAQELLKLLAVIDPVPTIDLMVRRRVLAPVLPEIGENGVDRLARVVARERTLGLSDPIRRLAALLPTTSSVVEAIGAGLKLSNAQRRRLVLAAGASEPGDPRALAYAIGTEGARDRLLIGGDEEAFSAGWTALDGWLSPRLPVSGGDLIALGLPRGPIVAETLARVERRWVEERFPDTARTRELAAEEVAQALAATR